MSELAWLLVPGLAALGALAWRKLRRTSTDEVPMRLTYERPTERPTLSQAPEPLLNSSPTFWQAELARPKSKPVPTVPDRVSASDWRALADEFRRIRGPVVSAERRQTASGDAWRICGGLSLANEDCQVLCERAGAMLLASPDIAGMLSADIMSDSTAAGRWLRFVHEVDAGSRGDDGQGESGNTPTSSEPFVSDLPGVSAKVCITISSGAEPVPQQQAINPEPPRAFVAEPERTAASSAAAASTEEAHQAELARLVADAEARAEEAAARRIAEAAARRTAEAAERRTAEAAAQRTAEATRRTAEEIARVRAELDARRESEPQRRRVEAREESRLPPPPTNELERARSEQEYAITALRRRLRTEADQALAEAVAQATAAQNEVHQAEIARLRAEAGAQLSSAVAEATAQNEARQAEIARLRAEAGAQLSSAVAEARASEAAEAATRLESELSRLRTEIETRLTVELERARAEAVAPLEAELARFRQQAEKTRLATERSRRLRNSETLDLLRRGFRIVAQGALVAAVAFVLFNLGPALIASDFASDSISRLTALVPKSWFGNSPSSTEAVVRPEERPVSQAAPRAPRVREAAAPGLLTVFSRIPVELSVGGRRIGTNDDTEIVLAAGRHELELTNARFNFRARAAVQIVPHRLTSYTVPMPDGLLQVDAPPGAEVWVEGRLIGVAPVTNIAVPIGTREVRIRQAGHGERREVVEVVQGRTTRATLAF